MLYIGRNLTKGEIKIMKKKLFKKREIKVDLKLYAMAGSENSQTCTNVFCGPVLPPNPPAINICTNTCK